jgi:hypothetical protein
VIGRLLAEGGRDVRTAYMPSAGFTLPVLVATNAGAQTGEYNSSRKE